MTQNHALTDINQRIVDCQRCPRLIAWCTQVAREKVKRHQDETYWGKPLPSLGDPEARLLIVGLAPAAHGANRTGRLFTGDRSGDWLFRAMYRAGFTNQPITIHKDDGLTLINAYISAVAHCAPPLNKLLKEEIEACTPYLEAELRHMAPQLRVIVALGSIAFFHVLHVLGSSTLGYPKITPKPRFGHGVEVSLSDSLTLIGSYHPSQQNTFTGKLTEAMLDQIFERAKDLIDPTDITATPD